MSEQKSLYDIFAQKCSNLLEENDIRFAGLLDPMGNLVVGGFKKGIEPLKDEVERKKMFMEAVLRVRTRQDFDDNLGPVRYAASRRDAVVMMTFPVLNDHVLLISAEPHVDIDKTANKIMTLYEF
ncbi:DUF6659 family protein [Nitrosopumilus sp.]|uniref:DUF6659 family protein n=1 Tax=Nitrosopumilus sp. TaxID=2024843 RepID=UPI003B5B590C